jgi:hypothetical protein
MLPLLAGAAVSNAKAHTSDDDAACGGHLRGLGARNAENESAKAA